MLAVNAAGIDYLLYRNIGSNIPDRRRETFARRYGPLLHAVLQRLMVRSPRTVRYEEVVLTVQSRILKAVEKPLVVAPFD